MKRYDWSHSGMVRAGDGEWVLRGDANAAITELISALRDMGDMFCRQIEGRPGPDDAAQRWDRARAAVEKFTHSAADAASR